MSWIINDIGKDLMVGELGAALIEEIIGKIKPGQNAVGQLEELIQTATAAKNGDMVTLARYLLGPDKDAAQYARFATRIYHLEKLDADQRRLAWGDLAFEKNVAAGDPVTLGFKAAGAVGFEIMPEEDDATPEALDEAIIRFSLNGEISGKMGAAAGTVSAGLSLALQRSLTWDFGYDEDHRVYKALGNALVRVAQPFFKFDAMLSAFNGPTLPDAWTDGDDRATPASLKHLTYQGSSDFGAQASFKGKLAQFDFFVGGHLKLRHDFTHKVTPALLNEAGAYTTLDVAVDLRKSRERGFDLAFGYSIGLSAFGPGLAAKLLGRVKTLKGFLDKVEALGEDAGRALDKLIKPGSALKDVIDGRVKALLDTPTGSTVLDNLLIDILGKAGGAQTQQLVVNWLSSAIDNLSDLPLLGALDDLRTEILNKLKTKASQEVKDLIEATLKEVASDIQTTLNGLATKLDANVLSVALGKKVNDLQAGLKELLGQARSFLGKLAKGIEQANAELIGIHWARSRRQTEDFRYEALIRIEEAGAETYQQLILDPGETLLSILSSDTIPPGLKVMKNDFTAGFSTLTKDVVGLNILTMALGSEKSLLSKLDVKVIGGVVTIDLEGRLENITRFKSESRSLVISNFVSLAASSQVKFQLAFSQVEKNWNDNETFDFIAAFQNNGVEIDVESSIEMRAFYLETSSSTNAKLPGIISALLSIDPDTATAMMSLAAARPSDHLHALAATALFESDNLRRLVERWIVKIPTQLKLALGNVHSDLPKLSRAFVEKKGKIEIAFEHLLQPGDDRWVKELRRAHDSLAKSKSEKLKLMPLNSFISIMERAYEGCRKLSIFFQETGRGLKLAIDLRNSPVQDENQLRLIYQQVEKCQEMALQALSPWTDVGLPIGTQQRFLPIALFNILQAIAVETGSTWRPDIFFTLDFKERGKKMFVDSLN